MRFRANGVENKGGKYYLGTRRGYIEEVMLELDLGRIF